MTGPLKGLYVGARIPDGQTLPRILDGQTLSRTWLVKIAWRSDGYLHQLSGPVEAINADRAIDKTIVANKVPVDGIIRLSALDVAEERGKEASQ